MGLPIVLVGLGLPSTIPASSIVTLCNANEKIVYSCATGSHIISLCASANISSNLGYLQYRFGSRAKLELIYPDKQEHPAHLFTPGILTFSGGGGAYLQFRKPPYAYTLFSAIGNWWHSGKGTAEGVAVRKDGREVANFPCRKDRDFVEGELGPDFFGAAGLGEPTANFEIPEAFFPK